MAGIIGLFLSSLCVIKVVRASSYLFIFCVLITLTEARDRTVQEDRRETWGKGICLRHETNIPSPFISSHSNASFALAALDISILSLCRWKPSKSRRYGV